MQQQEIRNKRLLSILKSTISRFLLEESEEGIFISLVDLRLYTKGNTYAVYCSVFPKEAQQRTFAFLKRKEGKCREYIKKNTQLRSIPHIRFKPVAHIPFKKEGEALT